MKTVADIRRENLAILIKDAGGVGAFSTLLGKPNSSQVSQWLNASPDSKTGKPRQISDASARHLERASHKIRGWLDHDHASDQNIPTGAHPILVWDAPEDLPEGQYVLIPRRRVALSAGNGRWCFEEEEAPPLAFSTQAVRRLGLRAKNAVVVHAEGDSMEPGIRNGDLLLIDLAARDLRDEQVYALRYGAELRVKRLRRRWDGALILQSDNPDKTRYPDETLPPAAEAHVEILGRVIYRAGEL